MFVFVYGTLKEGYHNHRLLVNNRLVGRAELRGYGVYNLPHGMFPAVEKGTIENKVIGEVYEISPTDLVKLDRLEGYYEEGGKHNLYNREEVYVRLLDGKDKDLRVRSFVYLYNRQSEGKPVFIESGEWIKKGYRIR